MKTILTSNILESDFHIFGRYAKLINPETPYIGKSPIKFYRDILPLGGNETLSLSITLVDYMPLNVEVLEYHSSTGECFLTLDGDTIICVAPATAEAEPNINEMKAFFIPKGVAVYIHPGVWHYAPFPVDKKQIHSLVMLPERTYANDCIKYELESEGVVKIDYDRMGI